jgi:arylsulfatase A-like enzyme
MLVDGELVTVRTNDITLAETLYRGGYQTALFGLWGVGPEDVTGTPNQQGFETFYGWMSAEEARDYYPETVWRNDVQEPVPQNAGGNNAIYGPDLIVDEVSRYLARRNPRPFFLTVAFPMEITGRGDEVPELGQYADEDWPEIDKTKAAMLTRVDGYIAQIMEHLKFHGLGDNTVVIVTSDNGPDGSAGADLSFFNSTGGLRGEKGQLYEGGIRVPLVIRWAGPPRSGRVCNLPWAMWDMLPTLADMTATLLRPRDIAGTSIFARRINHPPAGSRPTARTTMYWEKHQGGFSRAARGGDWKAVSVGEGENWELFDLSTDVMETQDVAEQSPAALQAILEYIDTAKPDDA